MDTTEEVAARVTRALINSETALEVVHKSPFEQFGKEFHVHLMAALTGESFTAGAMMKASRLSGPAVYQAVRALLARGLLVEKGYDPRTGAKRWQIDRARLRELPPLHFELENEVIDG